MRKETWYVVTAENSVGSKASIDKPLQFVVSPSLVIVEDSRDLNDILASAQDKGYETRFSSIWLGVSRQRRSEIERAVREKLIRMGHYVGGYFDVSIDLSALILKY